MEHFTEAVEHLEYHFNDKQPLHNPIVVGLFSGIIKLAKATKQTDEKQYFQLLAYLIERMSTHRNLYSTLLSMILRECETNVVQLREIVDKSDVVAQVFLIYIILQSGMKLERKELVRFLKDLRSYMHGPAGWMTCRVLVELQKRFDDKLLLRKLKNYNMFSKNVEKFTLNEFYFASSIQLSHPGLLEQLNDKINENIISQVPLKHLELSIDQSHVEGVHPIWEHFFARTKDEKRMKEMIDILLSKKSEKVLEIVKIGLKNSRRKFIQLFEPFFNNPKMIDILVELTKNETMQTRLFPYLAKYENFGRIKRRLQLSVNSFQELLKKALKKNDEPFISTLISIIPKNVQNEDYSLFEFLFANAFFEAKEKDQLIHNLSEETRVVMASTFFDLLPSIFKNQALIDKLFQSFVKLQKKYQIQEINDDVKRLIDIVTKLEKKEDAKALFNLLFILCIYSLYSQDMISEIIDDIEQYYKVVFEGEKSESDIPPVEVLVDVMMAILSLEPKLIPLARILLLKINKEMTGGAYDIILNVIDQKQEERTNEMEETNIDDDDDDDDEMEEDEEEDEEEGEEEEGEEEEEEEEGEEEEEIEESMEDVEMENEEDEKQKDEEEVDDDDEEVDDEEMFKRDALIAQIFKLKKEELKRKKKSKARMNQFIHVTRQLLEVLLSDSVSYNLIEKVLEHLKVTRKKVGTWYISKLSNCIKPKVIKNFETQQLWNILNSIHSVKKSYKTPEIEEYEAILLNSLHNKKEDVLQWLDENYKKISDDNLKNFQKYAHELYINLQSTILKRGLKHSLPYLQQVASKKKLFPSTLDSIIKELMENLLSICEKLTGTQKAVSRRLARSKFYVFYKSMIKLLKNESFRKEFKNLQIIYGYHVHIVKALEDKKVKNEKLLKDFQHHLEKWIKEELKEEPKPIERK